MDARRHARLGEHRRTRNSRPGLDHAANALIETQEADGYLGTYRKADRLALVKHAGWDVWSHKYCLIGLLSYYQYTGQRPALEASRKAADLLIATYPAKRSILQAGHHAGMAATSVLQPIVLLHRLTAERRYLNFAHVHREVVGRGGRPRYRPNAVVERARGEGRQRQGV
jgi:DUF1680 family protein